MQPEPDQGEGNSSGNAEPDECHRDAEREQADPGVEGECASAAVTNQRETATGQNQEDRPDQCAQPTFGCLFPRGYRGPRRRC